LSGVRPAVEAAALPAAGLAQLALSVVLLSSTWPLAKYAVLRGTSPLWFAEGRAALSAVGAWLLLAALGRVRRPGRADLPAVLGVGVFQLALFFLFAHLAVAWVPAGRTSVLANTTTMFVVPLSLLVLRETIPLRRWIAAALGLAGVAVLVGPWAIDWSQRKILVGHAFLLAAALSFSIAIIVIRRFPPRQSMFVLLPWCFTLAALLMLPVVAWREPGGGLGADPSAWAALLYVGLLAGSVGTWCVLQAAATLPSVVSSVGFLATPASGLILSSLFLGEPITPDLIVGTALILGGIGAAAWPARRRR
jgi:O-acetylserine/cysteine efflux transporter